MQVTPDDVPIPDVPTNMKVPKQKTASAMAENRHKIGSAPSMLGAVKSIAHRAHKAHQVAADLRQRRSSLPMVKLTPREARVLVVPESMERNNE